MSWETRLRGLGVATRNAVRWLAGDLRAHWLSALFSVAAAFVIWFVIEDFTNPRTEGRAPAQGSGIQVMAVNVPEGYLEPTLTTVYVQVRARESDFDDLGPEDFRAVVDLGDVDPAAGRVEVPVRVTTERDHVEVLQVIPDTVDVTLEPAFSKEVEVTANVTSPPPAGFRIRQVNGVQVQPDIDPPIVTIVGKQDLVERVQRVEIDANLANARTETFQVTGDLVARSESGNVIDVSMSKTAATATFEIEAVEAPITLIISAHVTGTPADGYEIVSVTVDPTVVEATGPQAVIEGLQGPLLVESVDVSNATSTITQPKTLDPPENVNLDTESVIVVVEIAPIQSRATVYVDPEIQDIPAGLAVRPSFASTQVRISGNQLDIDAIRQDLSLLQATVSVAGAQAGVDTYTPTVTAPEGVTVESVSDVTIELAATGP